MDVCHPETIGAAIAGRCYIGRARAAAGSTEIEATAAEVGGGRRRIADRCVDGDALADVAQGLKGQRMHEHHVRWTLLGL